MVKVILSIGVHSPGYGILGFVSGLIYILGGLSELGMELGTLESYNPVTQEWLNLAPCHIPRAYTGLVVCDGCLYAVGGWNEDHGALDSVERYHIEKVLQATSGVEEREKFRNSGLPRITTNHKPN